MTARPTPAHADLKRRQLLGQHAASLFSASGPCQLLAVPHGTMGIRSGKLLLLSDPVAERGVVAFPTEKNLNRFTTLYSRMYYGEYNRLYHSPR